MLCTSTFQLLCTFFRIYKNSSYQYIFEQNYRAAKVRDVDGSWKPSKNSSGDKERIIGNEPNSRNEMPDSSRGPYIQRIQNDAREDEMEENMQVRKQYKPRNFLQK